MAERLQRGDTLERAVDASVALYRELLSRTPRLSEHQEIGLFGELLALEHLIGSIGEHDAVEAWLGPLAEEHDFGLPDGDVEVKTTLTERRQHVIGSASQLTSSPGRPLHLLSVQMTRAGAAADGQTLVDRVDAVRALVRFESARLEEQLARAGWKDRRAERLYTTRFALRSAPACFLVDDYFPAITAPALSSVVSRPELVSEVTYRIDVTDLKPVDLPAPFRGFSEEVV